MNKGSQCSARNTKLCCRRMESRDRASPHHWAPRAKPLMKAVVCAQSPAMSLWDIPRTNLQKTAWQKPLGWQLDTIQYQVARYKARVDKSGMIMYYDVCICLYMYVVQSAKQSQQPTPSQCGRQQISTEAIPSPSECNERVSTGIQKGRATWTDFYDQSSSETAMLWCLVLQHAISLVEKRLQ